MKKVTVFLSNFLTVVLFLGMSSASGQINQSFYPMNGAIQYAPAQPATIVSPPQALCECGCGSTGVCTENADCQFSIQPSPSSGPIIRNRKPLTSTMPTAAECIDGGSGTIPFYEKDIETKGTVRVPRKTKNCVETFKFEKKSYQLCGCTINVCVPCEVYCVESGRCEPIPVDADLVVRVRTEPEGGVRVADIWAMNVMGLPKPAVLGLKKTPAEILSEFGASVTF